VTNKVGARQTDERVYTEIFIITPAVSGKDDFLRQAALRINPYGMMRLASSGKDRALSGGRHFSLTTTSTGSHSPATAMAPAAAIATAVLGRCG